MNWVHKRVLVTGGAGFIGGALVDRLLTLGAEVTVIDKLLYPNKSWVWQAKLQRLREIYNKHGYGEPNLIVMDLRTERHAFQNLAREYDVVFHLSALFGGREFVDKYQTETSEILAIDHNVIMASYEAGIDRLHYSSSACVYPPSLNKPGYLLKEDDILSTGEGWRSSDNLYGFAKLMGELQLKVLHEEKGFKSSICRYLTVYGPGQFDATHAIAALIERALDKEDPYVVWGSGEQERGFTYVDDIVNGTILAAEKITDATSINLGWDKRYKIKDVAKIILEVTGHKPKQVVFDRSKPEGPFSRALDITRARQILGWEPKVDLYEGLLRTVEWHKELREKYKVPSLAH
jgi:UDP-glucose 4-epimerase